MARRSHAPERVINRLRHAVVTIAEGRAVADATRRPGRDRADLLSLAQRVRGANHMSQSEDMPSLRRAVIAVRVVGSSQFPITSGYHLLRKQALLFD